MPVEKCLLGSLFQYPVTSSPVKAFNTPPFFSISSAISLYDLVLVPFQNIKDKWKKTNKNVELLHHGFDSNALNINNKSKIPYIIIDNDRRWNLSEKIGNILEACRQLKKEIPLKVILLQQKSELADECILNPIICSEFYEKINQSWIYITPIKSSYELCVIESQMAGNYVIGVDDCMKRELYIKDKTGFNVNNSVEEIKKIILKIISNYHPNIPREYALRNFSWDVLIPKLLEKIDKNFN